MNENLKGHINTTLRDDRADTYGFSSTIDFRNDLGGWSHRVVPTSRTAQTLVAIFQEMNDLKGARPITEEELTTIRKAMVPDSINHFETIADVAAEVAFLVSHQLPDDHFALEPDRFDAVSQTDVDWLAQHLLTPRWMTVLVVGDRSRMKGLSGSFRWVSPSICSTQPASPFESATRLSSGPPSLSANQRGGESIFPAYG